MQFFGGDNSAAAPARDPDGDGQDNLFEFTAGLVPTDATSRFVLRIEAIAGQSDQVRLVFSPLVVGRTYTPQLRTDLATGTWAPLTTFTQADNGSQRTITDTAVTGSRKFYRIEITGP